VITTCPRCFSAEDVTWQRLPDRTVLYTCDRRHGGEGPHTWLKSLDQLALHEEAAEGVTDELLEPLSSCVLAGEPFVEYGVVEYRFRQRFSELFKQHVLERGHGVFGPKAYTASSVRFGVALARLARSKELVSRYDTATGAWSYNGQITYWARPPVTPGPPLTWARFCAEIGRSPEWTEKDKEGLT
jgi:hypothetical protein